MDVLFIGGTGVISTACSTLAVERGIQLTLLNRGNRCGRLRLKPACSRGIFTTRRRLTVFSGTGILTRWWIGSLTRLKTCNAISGCSAAERLSMCSSVQPPPTRHPQPTCRFVNQRHWRTAFGNTRATRSLAKNFFSTNTGARNFPLPL